MEKTTSKVKMSRYGNDPAERQVQSLPQSVKESRFSLYGTVPIDALKAMDKRKFSIIADATLDEVEETFGHVFVHFELCDNCDEPATRIGLAKVEDNLDRGRELTCDTCKFSRSVKVTKDHTQANAVHRAKALIAMLKDRR